MEAKADPLLHLKYRLIHLEIAPFQTVTGICWLNSESNSYLLTYDDTLKLGLECQSNLKHVISISTFVDHIYKRSQLEDQTVIDLKLQYDLALNELNALQTQITDTIEKFKKSLQDELDSHILMHTKSKAFISKFNIKQPDHNDNIYQSTVELVKDMVDRLEIDINVYNQKLKDLKDTISLTALKPKLIPQLQHILSSFVGLESNSDLIPLISKVTPLNSIVYGKPIDLRMIEETVISNGKSIPHTNGFDLHPSKSIYATLSNHDGDLVIRDLDKNEEIVRTRLNNYCYEECVENCLWSPSGNQLMITTYSPPSIYIFDIKGTLLKSFIKTHTSYGWGATWLSENEIACGYNYGMIKIFNLTTENEIWSYKLKGCTQAWGIENLSRCEFLVGDSSSIYNINWELRNVVWTKSNWHSGRCRLIKLNKEKDLLLTGSDDFFVRLMKIECRSKIWESQLNNIVQGLVWLPGENYILALSNSSVVGIEPHAGQTVFEYDKFSYSCCTLRFNEKQNQVLIGDDNGIIRKFKLTLEEKN